MLVRINNLRVGLDNEHSLSEIIAHKLRVSTEQIKSEKVLRRAVDARRKNNVCLVYHVLIDLEESQKRLEARIAKQEVLPWKQDVEAPLNFGQESLADRPVVIGLGPAGLMAALELAKYGYKPLVLERGKALQDRIKDVERFWSKGEFNPVSNVQFGAGGAGTFSDGKLTTRVNDAAMGYILQTFVEAGAPEAILYEQKPHVGTDKLRAMVTGLITAIENYGGEIKYETQAVDFLFDQGKLTGVRTNSGEKLTTNAVILACGHSARDTYQCLVAKKVLVEAKPFAIGVRVEHEQELINKAQYGAFAKHPKLGAADYSLVAHIKETGRTAYSFCMCPGGKIVASASETGGVVTNGMSLYARDSGLANSALLVNVLPEDFAPGPLGGVELQRKYEQLAFKAAGENYAAPSQNTKSFLAGTEPSLEVKFTPSYQPSLKAVALEKVLPKYVTATLKAGLREFDRKLSGFAEHGLLVGVETRSSAPVRIMRGENGESISHRGLYPTGEGAGYAGGIMSAALDGYHQARHLMERFKGEL